MMIGFFAYLGCAIMFYALAIFAFVTKEPVGIWKQDKKHPKVRDVKGYNRAVAVLFAAYATVLLLGSLPMLFGLDGALPLTASVLCVALGTIAMFIAVIKIDEKYRVR